MAGEITVGGNILASHTGIDGAGSLTLGNTVVPASSYMFRNKIINGNFDIWQRGTSQTSTGYGSVDRWNNDHSGSSKTASQQAFTVGQTEVPGNPKYYLKHVVTSVAGSGNYCLTQQKIEDVSTLAGKTVTLSFWAKADSNKNIATEFSQNFAAGGSPSSIVTGIGVTIHSLTTSWQKFTTTVSIPSISGKTLGTDGNDYLHLVIWFESGSTYSSRNNSLGNQSGTFDIAQVQIEEGSVATPFEQRPYGVEEQLCKRYWCWGKFKVGGRATTGSGNRDNIFFSTTMRVHPTVYLSNEVKNGIGTTYPEIGGPNHFTVYWLGSVSSDNTTYYSEYSADAEL